MKQIPFNYFACPLDGLPLLLNGQSMRCDNNHNFDFDRKGTLNLLPVQFKKSKNPGDSKEMVDARTRFLEAGFYQPISDKLNELVGEKLSDNFTALDAGCGEGYYTEKLAECLQQKNSGDLFSMIGLDISKQAIIAAARRNKLTSWVVGTNARLPILDHSLDCIISLFGFPVWPEFKRVLKPGGRIIVAETGAEHLIELRHVLYPEIKEKTVEKIAPDGFTRKQQTRLHVKVATPSSTLLLDQIMMTPHGFRATQERIKAATEFSFGAMTLDVYFSVYGVKVAA